MSRALSKAITPQWYSVPVGGTIVIDDSDPNQQVPPQTHDDVMFVKLTAGLMDAGEYNEGKLTNETVTGSGAEIVATAEIAVGPEAGRVINLLNSENRYLMPGESSGAVADDKMQRITGYVSGRKDGVGLIFDDESVQAPTLSGALTFAENVGPKPGSLIRPSGTVSGVGDGIGIDSSLSPDARTGDKTDVKHQEVTAFRRIA